MEEIVKNLEYVKLQEIIDEMYICGEIIRWMFENGGEVMVNEDICKTEEEVLESGYGEDAMRIDIEFERNGQCWKLLKLRMYDDITNPVSEWGGGKIEPVKDEKLLILIERVRGVEHLEIEVCEKGCENKEKLIDVMARMLIHEKSKNERIVGLVSELA